MIVANEKSTTLLTELFTQLRSLGNTQPAAYRIYLYMLCAMTYDIDKVVVGQSPYGFDLVPNLGAAYAQCAGTPLTQSLSIIARHFLSDANIVMDTFRFSWRLLCGGYLFFESYLVNEDLSASNASPRLLYFEIHLQL